MTFINRLQNCLMARFYDVCGSLSSVMETKRSAVTLFFRGWLILILTQISTVILKFISQSLCPVTEQDRKCQQKVNFLELSSPHFPWMLKSWAVSRRTLNLRDLGICPSMFYTTQSTIFLRILARDLPSIAASFFLFWVGGTSLLH